MLRQSSYILNRLAGVSTHSIWLVMKSAYLICWNEIRHGVNLRFCESQHVRRDDRVLFTMPITFMYWNLGALCVLICIEFDNNVTLPSATASNPPKCVYIQNEIEIRWR